jgi:hypothetical protein
VIKDRAEVARSEVQALEARRAALLSGGGASGGAGGGAGDDAAGAGGAAGSEAELAQIASDIEQCAHPPHSHTHTHTHVCTRANA